ncbi:MAG: helix-turn-helix domain-containing protein [Pseudomonadota bacterium]
MGDSDRTKSDTRRQATTVPTLLLSTVAFALSRGFSFEELETFTGLSRQTLIATSGRVPDEATVLIWKEIAARAPPTEVPALVMAQSVPLSFIGGLVDGAQFASTAWEAISFLVENSTFVSDRLAVRLEDDADNNVVSMSVSHPLDTVDGGRLAEVGIAFSLRVFGFLFAGQSFQREVMFEHQPDGPVEVYERHLRAPVLFGQPSNTVVLDRSILSAPIAQAQFEVFHHIRTHYQVLRESKDGGQVPESMRHLRRAVLENAQLGDYRAASVAAKLGMGVRSAQRLAANHGMTLSTMIDDVRQARAIEYLDDPEISLSTVAALLGYSDDRAFRRAFKAWTGQTPSGFRRKRAA